MKKKFDFFFFLIILSLFLISIPNNSFAQSASNCLCHNNTTGDFNQFHTWSLTKHANTQNDVADELGSEWTGLPADSVINGSSAEDCIACHGAYSINANGGMTEAQTLNYFFSTTGGVFTSSTKSINTSEWSHVSCYTCHEVPANHTSIPSINKPVLKLYDSRTAAYTTVNSSSELCGSCHGPLRFADTDHLTYSAWKSSKHGHGGQADVAGELSSEWAGVSPDSVINGVDGENCIACHAPTAVKMNNGITEAEALNNFFTTVGGVITSSTTVKDTANWPNDACTTCHDPMNADKISFFNSTTGKYDAPSNADDLCGQCHGNLRFPGTDHLSYNIIKGTGGTGVANITTMPGARCVDCHMAVGTVDGSNAAMFHGHTWSPFVKEADGSTFSSCTNCHSSFSASTALDIVNQWKTDFADSDAIANTKITAAETQLQGSTDQNLLQALNEAKSNLTYAESDESGGFHNHRFTMSLVQDAISKANMIVTGVDDNNINIPLTYSLSQNYPNPFNPTTEIKFEIAKEGQVSIVVFDVLGKEIRTLVNEVKSPGKYSINFNGEGLSSGVYIYQLKAGKFISTKKMVLMK